MMLDTFNSSENKVAVMFLKVTILHLVSSCHQDIGNMWTDKACKTGKIESDDYG